jgi:hypothetical protein
VPAGLFGSVAGVAKQRHLCFWWRVILGDAPLDHINGFFSLGQNLLRLSLGRDKGVIVIHHGLLPPAPVELMTVRVRTFSNRELHVEGNPLGGQRRRRDNQPMNTS